MKPARLLTLGILATIAAGCWLDSPQEGAVYATHNVDVGGFAAAANEKLTVWTLNTATNQWVVKGTVTTAGTPSYHCVLPTNPPIPYDEYRFDGVFSFTHGNHAVKVTEEPVGDCIGPINWTCWNAHPELDPCTRGRTCASGKCPVHFSVSAR
jgi:hypothetical protein